MTAKQEKLQKCSFVVLGTRIGLQGPESVVSPIEAAYARFVDATGAAVDVTLEVPSADTRRVRLGDRTIDLARGLDLDAQVYRLFLQTVLDRATSHAVLHAGALAGPRGAFLLAGPSGSGKSALTLELLSRGHAYLSDDYAPLNLQTGRVAPFPRALALRPEGDAPRPAALDRYEKETTLPRLFDKTLIDPGAVFGEDRIATRGVPLAHVVLLTPDDPASDPLAATTHMTLIVRREARGRLENRLVEVDGVSIERRQEHLDLAVFLLRAGADGGVPGDIGEILEDDDVLYAEKIWGPRPDFDAEPQSNPIRRRLATGLLGREMLNRRAESALMKSLDGSHTRLFVDLAYALREAECFQLRVGSLARTADMIEDLVGSAGEGLVLDRPRA